MDVCDGECYDVGDGKCDGLSGSVCCGGEGLGGSPEALKPCSPEALNLKP